MKLASEWLRKAMSEKGEPSARRVVMVVGLLVVTPALLALAARFVPDAFAVCFVAYQSICGGVYVVPAFAPKIVPPKETP
jgi:hypothetical protein